MPNLMETPFDKAWNPAHSEDFVPSPSEPFDWTPRQTDTANYIPPPFDWILGLVIALVVYWFLFWRH